MLQCKWMHGCATKTCEFKSSDFKFFWVPFLSVIVFYLLNGYLLGWGYYEMIAFRHLGIKEAGVHRKSIWAMILLAGMIMTFLFMLPIVQFVAPIISVALICHLFHLSEFEEI